MFKRRWNPYLAGALAGLLLIFSVWISGKYFGTSTTFARVAAVIYESVGIDTSQIAYFTDHKGKYGAGALPDWQILFVIGIFVGSLISSKLSGEFTFKMVPDMWRERFGPSPGKRGAVAFVGGVIGLFGARLAGG
jgi:uncharacterized protein